MKTLPNGASEPTIKDSDTHVDAFADGSRDAGAIPAASTESHLASDRKVAFLIHLR